MVDSGEPDFRHFEDYQLRVVRFGGTVFCDQCGKSVPDEASFCSSCGNKLRIGNESQEAIPHRAEATSPVQKAQPSQEATPLPIALESRSQSTYGAITKDGLPLLGGEIVSFCVVCGAGGTFPLDASHKDCGQCGSKTLIKLCPHCLRPNIMSPHLIKDGVSKWKCGTCQRESRRSQWNDGPLADTAKLNRELLAIYSNVGLNVVAALSDPKRRRLDGKILEVEGVSGLSTGGATIFFENDVAIILIGNLSNPIYINYSDLGQLQFGGRGTVTQQQGGGYVGGGFGLKGALKGVVMAEALNALSTTTVTTIESIISITWSNGRLVILNTVYTPNQLAGFLAPVLNRLNLIQNLGGLIENDEQAAKRTAPMEIVENLPQVQVGKDKSGAQSSNAVVPQSTRPVDIPDPSQFNFSFWGNATKVSLALALVAVVWFIGIVNTDQFRPGSVNGLSQALNGAFVFSAAVTLIPSILIARGVGSFFAAKAILNNQTGWIRKHKNVGFFAPLIVATGISGIYPLYILLTRVSRASGRGIQAQQNAPTGNQYRERLGPGDTSNQKPSPTVTNTTESAQNSASSLQSSMNEPTDQASYISNSQVRNVTDYFLDAPSQLLGMIDDTTGKDLAQGARSSLIKLRDDHNGYLQVEGNALISKFNLALFNMKDGSHLLGIQEMGGSVAQIRFLRRTPAGQWNDATREVWPTISQEFIIDRFLKIFPKAGKSIVNKVNTRGGSTVYYELPRNGTTIIAKSWIDETEFYGKELFKIRFNRERFEVVP